MDAKNDLYIKQLLADPDYRCQPNGVVEKITRYRDLPLTKGQKKPVWKPIGFLSHSKIKVLYYKYKNLQIKRIQWIHAFGELKSTESVIVKDGNESNCRPDNLAIETMLDIKMRTYQSGRKASNARLNWNQVAELRSDWKTGTYTQKKLGEKYGISQVGAGRIANNSSYKRKNNHKEEK